MDTVYLFPLNNSLTLKKVPLPFHIFEPKYKQMIQDALSNNKRIVVIPSRSSFDNLVCISGIPIVLQKYEDGRMDIVITGIEKVKLISNKKETPYAEYFYEPIQESLKFESIEDYSLIEELLWVKINEHSYYREHKQQFKNLFSDSETVINYAILILIPEVSDKINIMELNSSEDKIHKIIDILSPSQIDLTQLYNYNNIEKNEE